MPNTNYQEIFSLISDLIMHHSPSGDEKEVNQFILAEFAARGVAAWVDRADNIIAKIPGQDSTRAIAITGHKDEIGMLVKSIDNRGRIEIRKLGGSFPWVYGEGVVDILGDNETISGILSFGSRHVSHESPQKSQQEKAPLLWENTWVETKLTTQELELAGVRAGSRVVVGKHRKQPLRIKDYIAGYTLDNKAAVAILLGLAETVKTPPFDVYLVASAKEEVGAIGALYFTQNQKIEALIALEICPLAPEYPIEDGEKPVLLSQDGYGIYDEGLNRELREAAKIANIEIQLATISGFGSDASLAMKFGHVARGACLSFPTQNTHGYEIAHLGAIENCLKILQSYCR
jgi:putative aminopeptidase FrvX